MRRKTILKPKRGALGLKSRRVKNKVNDNLPRKVRQPSKSTIKRRAWDAFSRFIRTRDCLKTTGCADWGLCITCDKRYHFKLLQAGHFISGRHNANLFNEKGCHAQCYNCNINLRGNTLEYRRAIIAMYGDGYDEVLEKEAVQIVKYSVEDLINLANEYKMKVDNLQCIAQSKEG